MPPSLRSSPARPSRPTIGLPAVTWKPAAAVDYLARANGRVRGGIADGRPALTRDVHLAEAILALSGTTNGDVAMQGWRALEERTRERYSIFDPDADPELAARYNRTAGAESNVSGIMRWLDKQAEPAL